jgi:hypothetical protein
MKVERVEPAAPPSHTPPTASARERIRTLGGRVDPLLLCVRQSRHHR